MLSLHYGTFSNLALANGDSITHMMIIKVDARPDSSHDQCQLIGNILLKIKFFLRIL